MIRGFLLLAMLAGTVSIDKAQANPAPRQIADSVAIGWTKAQVEEALGKPDRKSRDKNTWYYGKRAIKFTEGKVSGFPGAAG